MYFSRAISNEGDPAYLSHRGLTFFKLNRTDEAIVDFNNAIGKASDNPDA